MRVRDRMRTGRAPWRATGRPAHAQRRRGLRDHLRDHAPVSSRTARTDAVRLRREITACDDSGPFVA
jgi:hypothetical protein